MADPLIFAFAAPLLFALMNVYDKFILSKYVKNAWSFAVISGILNIILGGIIALFVDWSSLTLASLFFPVLVAILFGVEFILYFDALKEHDVGHIVGVIFIYPALVALASLIFLGEVLGAYNYLGIFLVVLGVVILFFRMKRYRVKNIVFVILMILAMAAGEFFVKVSTLSLGSLQGTLIMIISSGMITLFMLFRRSIRADFMHELKNIGWAMISEIMTFFSFLFLFLAMEVLPAGKVATIGALQPLFVLLMEKGVDHSFYEITQDKDVVKKFAAVILVIVGIVLVIS